jgi:hypothetical protein
MLILAKLPGKIAGSDVALLLKTAEEIPKRSPDL